MNQLRIMDTVVSKQFTCLMGLTVLLHQAKITGCNHTHTQVIMEFKLVLSWEQNVQTIIQLIHLVIKTIQIKYLVACT